MSEALSRLREFVEDRRNENNAEWEIREESSFLCRAAEDLLILQEIDRMIKESR